METILGRKREKIWKGLKGKGGKDLKERGQRIEMWSREKISARGERGERISTGKEGGKMREEREKIPGGKGLRGERGKGSQKEKGEDLENLWEDKGEDLRGERP